MFRVICINSTNENDQGINGLPAIPIGKVVTVIDEKDYMGSHYYRFSEYFQRVNGYRLWYVSTDFIPVSDIDETELVNTKEEELCGSH